ncbi:MAG: A24 family peptidase [Bryobacteraceae bacterium]|jgi:prepilin peptidase CpaA
MNALAWMAVALGCAATFDDLRRRQVANGINLAGVAAGLGWHAGTSGATGLERSAGGAAVGFLVFLVFYVAGAMGAGDIKLMAAFGALLGPSGILLAALFAAPAGGLMAAAWLAWKRGARDIPYAIPYAPAITLGAWLALVGRG